MKVKLTQEKYSWKYEWRIQHCTVSSVEEFIRIYGLDEGDCEYEILEIKAI